jgi:hypothetical protein
MKGPPIEKHDGDRGGKGVTVLREGSTDGPSQSTVARSQACLTESIVRPLPLSPCGLGAKAADCQVSMSGEAPVDETVGSFAGAEGIGSKHRAVSSGRCFELALLNFVPIRIQGALAPSITSLVDSGSELNVSKADLVSDLPLEPIGEVSLRGVVGKPVNPQLIR